MLNSTQYFDGVHLKQTNAHFSLAFLLRDEGYLLGANEKELYEKSLHMAKTLYRYITTQFKHIDFGIDEDATIDQAILVMAKYIDKNTEYHLEIGSEVKLLDFQIGIGSFGQFPIKPFFDMRKNKKAFPTLMKFLRVLDMMGVPFFDNYTSEMICEQAADWNMYEDGDAEEVKEMIHQKHVHKTRTILIEFVLEKMREIPCRVKLTKHDVNRVVKEDPRWKEFLMHILALYKMNFHIDESLNYRPVNNDGQILDINDCFQTMWLGSGSDNSYDHELSMHMDMYAGDSYIVEPCASINLSHDLYGKGALREFKKRKERIRLFYSLFTNDYAIFRY